MKLLKSRAIIAGIAVAIAAIGVVSAIAAVSGGSKHVRVLASARNATLGKTILVTTKGRTLYSLSVERNGRFICTDRACLSFWTPLVIAKNRTPTGASKLATVKRPDGHLQVTYAGAPLYTFTHDRRKGDVQGEGFKDVGVWHAAVVAGGGATPPPTTTSGTTTDNGGGGGYYG